MFKAMDADEVVAEGNQGGEMVRHVIHSLAPNIPVKIVWARAAKQARAEPVAMLYQQHRMHHIGSFGMLETQMVTWEPESGLASPDRIDALVWAARHLFVTAEVPRTVPVSPIYVPFQ
jgi:phage terminase large subunit-like protein